MIQNDEQLQTTLERIRWFQQQVAQLRKTGASRTSHRQAAIRRRAAPAQPQPRVVTRVPSTAVAATPVSDEGELASLPRPARSNNRASAVRQPRCR